MLWTLYINQKMPLIYKNKKTNVVVEVIKTKKFRDNVFILVIPVEGTSTTQKRLLPIIYFLDNYDRI